MASGSLYIDGEDQFVEDVERVQVEFDWDGSAGCDRDDCREAGEHVEECDEYGMRYAAGIEAWCNSAALDFDDADDSVTVSISVGDPRGAFTMSVRMVEGDDGRRLVLHVPTPSDGWLHRPLRELHAGAFEVG